MLISFSTENWQSFRDKATLSMLASRERQHKERIANIDKYGINVLPVAAIYGGNASGKTKLFNALAFAKYFIVNVTQPDSFIAREHFKLDDAYANKPTKFNFELLIEDIFYEFSFAVTSSYVTEEKLIKFFGNTEKVIYQRDGSKITINDITLKKEQRLQFLAEGTRSNQLFLTNTVDQKMEHFKKIYDWFKNTLVLIAPNSTYSSYDQFMQEGMLLYNSMNNALVELDTGITSLGEEKIPIENFPQTIRNKILENLPDGSSVNLHLSDPENRFVITKKNGVLSAKKLIAYHKTIDGKKVKFEFGQESAGTLRIIDILPAFFALCTPKSPKIFIIDELDRCLHTLLTRALLESFLSTCTQEGRSQLLFTTHDALLIDQQLFRRDEIWVTERNSNGGTSLFSFGEYKNIRFDKDIRKSYLRGHLGGIPKINLLQSLSNADGKE